MQRSGVPRKVYDQTPLKHFYFFKGGIAKVNYAAKSRSP
jgi:hypothetical protein